MQKQVMKDNRAINPNESRGKVQAIGVKMKPYVRSQKVKAMGVKGKKDESNTVMYL